MSVPRIGDRVRKERRSKFVGRDAELLRLSAAIEENGPALTFVLGLGGMGKTSLLEEFAAELEERAVPLRRVDCGAVEPTATGLLTALGELLGTPLASPGAAADALTALGARVVLTFDRYEAFRLLDGWLRREFLPALPSSVRVFAFGRMAPLDSWTADPGWASVVQTIRLGPLEESAARLLLERHGVDRGAIPRLLKFTQGHPLALRLAAQTLADPSAGGADRRPAVEVLAPLFLRDVRDDPVRHLLEAGCLVRRATRSVLTAMVPDGFSENAFEALRELPFVEAASDGLAVHETVRSSVAAALHALDPVRYQSLRGAAWACLRAELGRAPRAELWRYTADMLYLIDRPQIREAFFPADAVSYGVEAARAEDWPAIRELAHAFDEGGAASVETWWNALPRAFHVVRERSGRVVAFYNFALARDAAAALGDRDPQVLRWLAHLRAEGVSLDRPVFFSPRVLAEGTGEAPSPLSIACWLDCKRAYLEQPNARRIYVGMARPAVHLAVLGVLGFEAPPELGPNVNGVGIGTIVLDFGADGVLGWLSCLVDAQFAGGNGCELDASARALRFGKETVPLTKLEFGVMRYLEAHSRRVVTRDELLEDVWGQSFGGSNVVDAVVKSIRKKLGPHGHTVETVIGHGYRFAGFGAVVS